MPIVSLIVFLVSFSLRIWQIPYPINVDEAFWMLRGASFIRRFLEGNFIETYLRHHPGVTNMWLTGTGHLLSSWISSLFPNWLGVDEIPYLHSCFSAYECPISLWIAPRFLQALVTSGCMVGVYVSIEQLLGKSTALIAISLLTLEPFFLAYQRFITTDALQADFSILSVLLLLLYLRGNSNWLYLIGSGICLGLATASKIPALFILPAVVIWFILIELGFFSTSFTRRGWQKQTINLFLWVATTIVIIILIWPTLWVNLVGTVPRIYSDLLEESARGDLFFLGQVQTPGLAFYPLILLYRLSPILQFGIVCCLLALAIPKLQIKNRDELIALLIVVIVVLGILSTSDSKIGRYIVVIMPELAIIAAAGYINIWSWLTQKKQDNQLQRFGKSIGNLLLSLIIIQSIVLINLTPQYVSYYNPLFGGASMGQKFIHIGIGEGLDKAAKILNKYPNVENLKVASWYRWAFVPYFKGKAVEGWSNNPVKLLEINRVIIYINQIQRNLPSSKFVEYFVRQKPLHTISLAGIDYLKIYPGLAPLPEELNKLEHPVNLLLNDNLNLLGYDLEKNKIRSEESLLINFYWQVIASISEDLQFTLSLVNNSDRTVQNQKIDLVNGLIELTDIPPQTTLRDVQTFNVDRTIKPGIYKLKLNYESVDTSDKKINSIVIGNIEILE